MINQDNEYGLHPSFGILKNLKFEKLYLFLSSGERVRGTYSVGPIRQVNFNSGLSSD